jgi:hypothetical protein
MELESSTLLPGTRPTAYTSKEKLRSFTTNTILKVRSIRRESLDTYISVFGETFDLKSKVKQNNPVEPDAEAEAKAKVETTARGEAKVETTILDPYKDAFIGYTLDTEELERDPVTYKTRKEFDDMYLKDFDQSEKKIMRDLFMFIFSPKILEITAGSVELNKTDPDAPIEKLRIAFTKLSPYDKVPCHVNKPLVDALIKAINNRLSVLENELKDLTTLFPGPNMEVDIKKELRSNLNTFLYVLKSKNRHCILYSKNGTELAVDENLDWIYYFLKRHWITLHGLTMPMNNERKERYFKDIKNTVDVSKKEAEVDKDPKGAYEKLYEIALQEYNNLHHIQQTEKRIFDTLKSGPHHIPATPDVGRVEKLFMKGGAHDKDKMQREKEPDTVEDIREEIGRTLNTATNHLNLLKANDREKALAITLELINCKKGETLEDAVSYIHYKEPEWHSSTYTALEYKLGKLKGIEPFLQSVKHLLFLKEEELESIKYTFRDIPPLLAHVEPGKDRFYSILSRHPSLQTIIPKDIFFQSKKDLHISLERIEKDLPAIYPYTNALLADIYAVEEKPNIRSFGESTFLYMLGSLKPIRKTYRIFLPLLDQLETVEAILQNIDTKGPLPIDSALVLSLLEKVNTMPRVLQKRLGRMGLPLEVYVNEKVFIGPKRASGKGISVGILFFLYLFIKFHSVLDEARDSH